MLHVRGGVLPFIKPDFAGTARRNRDSPEGRAPRGSGEGSHAAVARRSWRGLLADVGQQGHEAGALDGVLDGALEGGAVAAPLPRKHLALAGAELFERLHILVVDERRPRTPFLGAETTAIFPSPSKLLANHRLVSLRRFVSILTQRFGWAHRSKLLQ